MNEKTGEIKEMGLLTDEEKRSGAWIELNPKAHQELIHLTPEERVSWIQKFKRLNEAMKERKDGTKT